MAVKVKFNKDKNPIEPTFVLAHRNGDKIGVIKDKRNLCISVGTNYAEFSFSVSKYIDGAEYKYWNDLKDLRLMWCKEYDTWFEITVELDDSDETVKTISGKSLCESELSQTVVYGIEINTEDDILRDDYTIPTTIYNENNPNASLLHRLLSKLPHYSIAHVDTSLIDLQYIFSFDGKSVKDCLDEIAEEARCVIVYGNGTKEENGKYIPARTISLYDAQCYCQICGYRDDDFDTCPKCGSELVKQSYGNDTTIFIDKENLTNEISFSNNVDNLKNCFKLEAGDDLMTATIMNCNPNGSQYIWHISDEMKEDMPNELVAKLNDYDEEYNTYKNQYVCPTVSSNEYKNPYNALVNKYKSMRNSLQNVDGLVIGYQALMNIIYETIDFDLFLRSELLPTVELSEINAETEIQKVGQLHGATVSVLDIDSASETTVNSTILSVVKAMISNNYNAKINEYEYYPANHTWRGIISITNFSDEEDTAATYTLTISVDGNYENFLKQKINTVLTRADDTIITMSTILRIADIDEFKIELKKYSLNALTTIHDCCQGCLDVLVEQGIADKDTWSDSVTDLYTNLYLNYFNKLKAIQNEISVRENELNSIKVYAQAAENDRNTIQSALNLNDYLGEDLWKVLCTYRRDDEYSNQNYISDGLNNAELFDMANKFLEVANKEIVRASTPVTTIQAKLKNLLAIPEFEKLCDYFELYNWLRIKVDDKIYKLRLLGYTIDFENLNELEVEFSNAQVINSTISDLSDILHKASSMSSSFDYVERQAEKGRSSYLQYERWRQDGLDATVTKIMNNADNQDILIDRHGLLARRYDDILGRYMPTQLKLINSTLAITNDNWETIKTAIGNFIYRNPETGEYETAYGINGEVIIGNIIIGEQLGIYSSNSKLKFDDNGLLITNNVNTLSVNPNSNNLFVLSNSDYDLIKVGADGSLHILGNGDIQSLNYAQTTITESNGTAIEQIITTTNGMRIDLTNGTIDTMNFKVDNYGSATMNDVTILSGIIKSANYSANVEGTKIDLSDGSIDSKNLKVDEYGVITLTSGVLQSANYIANVSGGKINLVEGTIDYKNFKVNSPGDVRLVNVDLDGGIIKTTNYNNGKVYDETEYTPTHRGCGAPTIDANTVPTNSYYLDLETGELYCVVETVDLTTEPPTTTYSWGKRGATLTLLSTGDTTGGKINLANGSFDFKNLKIANNGDITMNNAYLTGGTIQSSNYVPYTENVYDESAYDGVMDIVHINGNPTLLGLNPAQCMGRGYLDLTDGKLYTVSMSMSSVDGGAMQTTYDWNVYTTLTLLSAGSIPAGGKINLNNGTIDFKNFRLDSLGNITLNNATFNGGEIVSSNYQTSEPTYNESNYADYDIIRGHGVPTITNPDIHVYGNSYYLDLDTGNIYAVLVTENNGVTTSSWDLKATLTRLSSSGAGSGGKINLSYGTIDFANFKLDYAGNVTLKNVDLLGGIIKSSNYAETTSNNVTTVTAGGMIDLNYGVIRFKNFNIKENGSVTLTSSNATITGGVLQSPNYYVSGGTVTGGQIDLSNATVNFNRFKIDSNGVVMLSEATFTGGTIKSSNYDYTTSNGNELPSDGMKIDLSTGVMLSKNFKLDRYGNLTLSGGVIKSTNYVANSSGTKIDLTDGSIDSKNFSITSTGILNATGANISGTVTTTDGDYKTVLSSGQLKCYYNNSHTGNVGGSHWTNDSTKRGMAFQLDASGYYMTWSAKDTSNDSQYTTIMTYVRGQIGSSFTEGEGLYISEKLIVNASTKLQSVSATSLSLSSTFNANGGINCNSTLEIGASGDIKLTAGSGYSIHTYGKILMHTDTLGFTTAYDENNYISAMTFDRSNNKLTVGTSGKALYLTGSTVYINGTAYSGGSSVENGFTMNDETAISFTHLSDAIKHYYGVVNSTSTWCVNIKNLRAIGDMAITGDTLMINRTQALSSPQTGTFLNVGHASVSYLQLNASNISASTSISTSSDDRKKKDIEPLDKKYLDFIKLITPTKFRFIDEIAKSGRTHTGFIAQDVLQVMTDCGIDTTEFGGFVDTYKDGKEYALRYEEFIALILGYVQELESRVQTLEQNNN